MIAPAGEADAFAALFRAHYAPLRDYARRYVGCGEAAEDLVQEVLLRLWEQRGERRPREVPRAYLYAAVRNRALDALKRERIARRWRERAARERAARHVAPERADETLYAGELARVAESLVAALPERRRQAFLLRRRHHMSHAEIAAVMGIAPKTVEVQIGLALRALRRGLAEWLHDEPDPPAAAREAAREGGRESAREAASGRGRGDGRGDARDDARGDARRGEAP